MREGLGRGGAIGGFRHVVPAVIVIFCLPACGCVTGPARIRDIPATHSGPEVADELVALLDKALERLGSAGGVHAILTRQERLDERLKPQEVLDYLQRFHPHSLKIRWIGDHNRGREIVYVQGAYENRVLVRPGGLAGALLGELRLGLDDRAVIRGSRYPPDVAGYNRLVLQLLRIASKYRGAEGVEYRATRPFEKNGEARRLFEIRIGPGYGQEDLSRAIVEFDLDRSLPVEAIYYNRLGELREDYQWDRIELRNDLVDRNFTFGDES